MPSPFMSAVQRKPGVLHGPVRVSRIAASAGSMTSSLLRSPIQGISPSNQIQMSGGSPLIVQAEAGGGRRSS